MTRLGVLGACAAAIALLIAIGTPQHSPARAAALTAPLSMRGAPFSPTDGVAADFQARRPASTPVPTATRTPRPTASPSPAPSPTSPGGSTSPWHTKIVSTTFWVGELFNAKASDGSQVCSTYDSEWAYHWSGIDDGLVSAGASDCAGSIYGGCDGISANNGASCETEKRAASTNYFPSQVKPLENPFYLDLPFDDLNDAAAFAERCQVIPWAGQPEYAGRCGDQSFSYLKNRWVEIVDSTTGNTCYGQIEDAGPGQYHDANYVFGSTDARPTNKKFNGAGLDVSPALNGCLGFKELDGDSDTVSWRFVDSPPSGPWSLVVTKSGIDEQ